MVGAKTVISSSWLQYSKSSSACLHENFHPERCEGGLSSNQSVSMMRVFPITLNTENNYPSHSSNNKINGALPRPSNAIDSSGRTNLQTMNRLQRLVNTNGYCMTESSTNKNENNNSNVYNSTSNELPPLHKTSIISSSHGNAVETMPAAYTFPVNNRSPVPTTSLPPTRHLDVGVQLHPRGLVGLQNLGNTCFMNSCLQCISNIPALASYFQGGIQSPDLNQNSPTKGQVALAFCELIKSIWTGAEFTSSRPVELKRVIGRAAPRFSGYDQHDAQEFLRFLLDCLHDDLNRIKQSPAYYEIKDKENAKDRDVSNEYWKYYMDRNSSPLSDLFCGQLRSEIQCVTCKHRSVCFDVFWDLSLPIPKKRKLQFRMTSMFPSHSNSPFSSTNGASNYDQSATCSIQDCLKLYTDHEILQEVDGAYYCFKCKCHREVTKKISIYRLPQILVLHLKRFSYSSFSRDKVGTSISFPLTKFDIAAYCSSDIKEDTTTYDLTGVIHHVGTLNGGHYTAECLNEDTNSWYDFNDSSVSPLPKPKLSGSSAYILFYRHCNGK